MNWRSAGEFVRDHFDKLLLVVLVVYMIDVVIYLSVFSMAAPETIGWARELTAAFAGALVGLITGVRIASKPDSKPADDPNA